MKKLIGLAGLLLSIGTLLAKPLPPIGKRKYLLDSKRPERPAQIEGIEAPLTEVDVGIMKDPIPLGAKSVKNVPKKWIEPERVVSKTSKMKFEKVAVGGRYSVPRVTFDQERKEIKHAEEPIKHDYKKKAQESDQLLKDLNW